MSPTASECGHLDVTKASSGLSRLIIIVVNYRTPHLVIDCLESLVDEIEPGMKVMVSENGSGDDSAKVINAAIEANKWGGWASVKLIEPNAGFSVGNNFIIRSELALAEPPLYFMLLNPDTVVRPGAIRALMDFMDHRPDVGIAGGQLEDPSGEIQVSSHRFPNPVGQLAEGARLSLIDKVLWRCVDRQPSKDAPEESDWVSGAAMIIRRPVFESVGLLDEAYFLYFDEVDFCWRARRAGWRVFFVPASRIVHLEGVATGIKSRARRKGWWYESRRRFLVKSYGICGWLLGDALWAIGRVSLLVRRVCGLGGSVESDPRWFAYDLVWGDVRALINGSAFRIRGSEKIQ